jgi:cell division septum initiation protein DivIVA
VTSATEKTPEQIEREMLHTRESLTEKVEALEHEVAGTVEAVKSFVTNAPEAVSDTVKQAAAAVSESVKETFDITRHIQRHPLAAVGASALAGCIVSWLIFRDSASSNAAHMTSRMAEAAPDHPPVAPAAPTYAAPREPGLFDELFGMFGDKAKELARTALETVAASLRESIQTQIPRVVNDATAKLADNVACATDTSFADRFDARRGSV